MELTQSESGAKNAIFRGAASNDGPSKVGQAQNAAIIVSSGSFAYTLHIEPVPFSTQFSL